MVVKVDITVMKLLIVVLVQTRIMLLMDGNRNANRALIFMRFMSVYDEGIGYMHI